MKKKKISRATTVSEGVSEPDRATTKLNGPLLRWLKIMGLLAASGLVFSAAFPSPVMRWGFAPAAFVAIAPVIVAIRRMRLWAAPLYGLFYGFFSYAVVNYWLANFHPLSIFIVPTIYAGYFFVVFPALWLADRLFPRFGYLVQLVIWLAYELLRTKGYLGYAYGIIGYSQFTVRPLIQIADVFGVWGVSAIVVFASILLGHWYLNAGAWQIDSNVDQRRTPRAAGIGWAAIVYGAVVVLTVCYGLISPVDYSESRTWRTALIQQNVDPWRGGFRAYRQSLDILKRQSTRALTEEPDIVIWSETSFVPSIDYHSRYREDQERYELVRELLNYLDGKPVPFVIGNSDGQLVRNAEGNLERVDYNAVLLFDDGRLVDTYRKVHLVPFTEHFPYERTMPGLHRLLVENDTNFWEKGEEFTVFQADGVRFSTPICFEDTFGYLSREFVRNGAQVIVNMTNDSWAFSEASAMQHMAMAVFRAVENRRSVVRSTNGGMTTTIDPNGRITDIYPSFVEGYLLGEVPVYDDATTVYTRFGDWFAWFSVYGAAVLLVFGVGRWVIRQLTKNRTA